MQPITSAADALQLSVNAVPEQVSALATKAGAAEQKSAYAKFTKYLEDQGKNPAEYFREQQQILYEAGLAQIPIEQQKELLSQQLQGTLAG